MTIAAARVHGAGTPIRLAEVFRSVVGARRDMDFGPVDGVYRSAEPEEPPHIESVEPSTPLARTGNTPRLYTASGSTRALSGPPRGRVLDTWI